MNFTVTQVLIIEQQTTICLTTLLLYARHCLALLLALYNLTLDCLRNLWITVQIVIKLYGKELANKLTHRDTLNGILASQF